jgi:sulfate adenylyltransferase large subunit
VADLLRFCAVGSVDDGKSTLIGRLLHDTKQLFDDQVEAMAEASKRRGYGSVELAFATDGLRAEREQGITIDVAYRYAQTPRRKFIIADCPGHEQYTRNMATGASTAQAAIVVVDSAKGLREQTRRHLCIASLMGVRRVIVCVNKMDLIDWSREVFDQVTNEMKSLADKLGVEEFHSLPISALSGQGVVEPAHDAPWYNGPTFLELIETIPASSVDMGNGEFRLAVQWILRNPDGTRGYAGMLSGGPIRTGEAVVIQPSGRQSKIVSVYNFDGPLDVAWPGSSVTLAIEGDIDISRGDMIVPATSNLSSVQELTLTVCWFSDRPLTSKSRFAVKHTTRRTPAIVSKILGTIDVNNLELQEADEICANEIGRIEIQVSTPLAADDYMSNRTTGSLVIVDPHSNATLGAAMVERSREFVS